MRPLILVLALACTGDKRQDSASPGDGGDASDGTDGTDGTDASDGTDGTDGTGGAPCTEIGDLGIDFPNLDHFYWGGSPNPSFDVAVEVIQPACEAFVAQSSEAWLLPELAPDGSSLRLVVDGAAVNSGRHHATVELRDQDSASLLATVEFDLSALTTPAGSPERKVLVVGVDGMDGAEMPAADLPTLSLLGQGGTWTWDARTQTTGATSSGPGWTSILSGVEVSRHGVTRNGGYDGRDTAYPSFLLRSKQELGATTAAAIQWPDIFLILEDDALDQGSGGSQATVTAAMAGALRASLHDVHFVHLDDVDHAGHAGGFVASHPDYVTAMEQADADIGTLLSAILDRPDLASEEWLIIVTSDHGGDAGGSHGPLGLDYEQIPLIVAGATVPKLELPAAEGSHMDVHPTVIDFLGLDPGAWVLDGTSRASPRELDCGDGEDDDGDGLIDCDDPDCADASDCWECRVDGDLGSDIGKAVLSGVTPVEGHLQGSCGGGSGEELIYSWTAPADGRYGFDTMQNYRDTVLYLLDGDCHAEELACNESTSSGQRSSLAVDLLLGQTVTVVLDSDAGATGDADLAIYPHSGSCPDGDLGQATGSFSEAFTHVNTVHTGSCPPAVADRWWTWQAPSAGTWTIDTIGSNYDTVLYILDSCGGAELACNDDGSGTASTLGLTLGEGDTVVIGVGSFAGRTTTATTVLNITGP